MDTDLTEHRALMLRQLTLSILPWLTAVLLSHKREGARTFKSVEVWCSGSCHRVFCSALQLSSSALRRDSASATPGGCFDKSASCMPAKQRFNGSTRGRFRDRSHCLCFTCTLIFRNKSASCTAAQQATFFHLEGWEFLQLCIHWKKYFQPRIN